MDNTKTLVTEQLNDKSNNIDRKNSIDILRIINQEDQTVPKIIENHLEEINLVVERVVHAFKKGGRLFYIGAGTSGRLGVLDASECPPTYGTDPSMVQGIIAGGEDAMFKPVEGVEDSENEGIKDVEKADLRSEDIMIGITASGRAPYVMRQGQKNLITLQAERFVRISSACTLFYIYFAKTLRFPQATPQLITKVQMNFCNGFSAVALPAGVSCFFCVINI